jgi:YggT family protein
MITPILFLFDATCEILMLVILVSAILSWLIAFDVLNTRNRTVYQAVSMLDRVSTPLLAPIRRILPPLGGIDLSPIVFLLLLRALQMLVHNLVTGAILG